MGDMADTLDGMPQQPPLNGIVIDQQDMRAHRKLPDIVRYGTTMPAAAEHPFARNTRILGIVPFWASPHSVVVRQVSFAATML
jgi:hypothetical protein